MSRFQRHPKITIAIILIVFIIIIDQISAILLIPKDIDYKNFRTSHSYYHHTLIPLQNRKALMNNIEYRVITNSLGFRDNSCRKVDLANDKRRIVFIGDSFTEGYGIDFDNTFVGLLSSKYDNTRYEILDAAAVSYSPKLYYLKTKYLLEQVGLHFNELVVCIDISDIEDEISYSSFEPKIVKNELEKSYKKARVKNFLRHHSFLFYSFNSIYNRYKKANTTEPTDKLPVITKLYKWKSEQEYKYERDKWTSDSTIFAKWGKTGLHLAEDYMNKLNELCTNNKIKMTIVVYPWQKQIKNRELNCRQVTFWRDFSSAHQIKFINLFPLFINNNSTENILNKYFIKGDEHWNEEGHKLVAETIFKAFNIDK